MEFIFYFNPDLSVTTLQSVKTVIQTNKMMLGRKAVTMLILVMNILRGHMQTCHDSEYWTGRKCCPMCPPGCLIKTHCTAFQSTSCLPCSDGTYMNTPTGLRLCFSCTHCAEGSGLKLTKSCTTKSDAICEAMEGFFCIDATEDGCAAAQKHKRCQPGQYISQRGTSSRDTECSDCRDGTFSNGTLSSCQPHTQCESLNLQLIKAGTVSADAECGEQSLNTGILIGIVLTVLFLLIGAAILLIWKNKWFIKGRKKRVKDSTPQNFKKEDHQSREEDKSPDTERFLEEQIEVSLE
ncbi:tumor necrosis factor receptor superfamily member 14-like [Symphorus nematophorus]